MNMSYTIVRGTRGSQVLLIAALAIVVLLLLQFVRILFNASAAPVLIGMLG